MIIIHFLILKFHPVFPFSWASPPPLLLHNFHLLLPTCTTTIFFTLEPRALNAKFQHFIPGFNNKISLLCRYHHSNKEGIGAERRRPKDRVKTGVTSQITLITYHNWNCKEKRERHWYSKKSLSAPIFFNKLPFWRKFSFPYEKLKRNFLAYLEGIFHLWMMLPCELFLKEKTSSSVGWVSHGAPGINRVSCTVNLQISAEVISGLISWPSVLSKERTVMRLFF